MVFSLFYYVFLKKEPARAARGKIWSHFVHALKKYIRLLRSELEPSHTRLKRYPAIENWGVHVFTFFCTFFGFLKHPTARIVSQLGGKADDRAEAPTGGLCRTASWPAQPTAEICGWTLKYSWHLLVDTELLMTFVGGHWNPNEICGWTLKS